MRAIRVNDGRLGIVEEPVPELKSGEVLIRVLSTAVNRADLLQAQGSYPPPPGASDIIGLEVAGTVVRLHENCSDTFRADQQVMALVTGGGYAEYVACPEETIMPIPSGVSIKEAGAIPEAFLTAFQIMFVIGNAQPGDTALIHAGGSGVGTALVQLGKAAGVRTYVTAGTQEKIDTAVRLGAMGGSNYKQVDWADEFLAACPDGANVILDCVGANYFEQNLRSVALEGRWVLYGLLSGGQVDQVQLGGLLRKRVSFISTTLRARSKEYKRDLVRRFSETANGWFENGEVRVLVSREFPLEAAQEAHDFVRSNQNVGKVILTTTTEANL